MSVYKFRIMFEEDENIYRDVEVRPKQTFSEFEELIMTAWGLPTEGKGQFFVSNDRMQKLKRIDQKTPVKRGDSQYLPMIIHYVEDPHQKFLYEYSGKQDLSFFIELSAIGVEKPGIDYPRILKTAGPSPVKKEDLYKHMSASSLATNTTEGLDEDDSQLLRGFGTEGEENTVSSATSDGDDDELNLSDDEEETGDEGESDFDQFSGGDDDERY